VLTTTSEINPLLDEVQPAASTAPSCAIVEIDQWRDSIFGIPANSTPLGALIEEYEGDPSKNAELQDARRVLVERINEFTPNTLKRLRLEKGLSQIALARQIGSTQAQIARVESGRQDVQVSTITRIAEALEIEPFDAIRAFLVQRDDVNKNA
jgi:DNA-binding Xre family transcriptional regulator